MPQTCVFDYKVQATDPKIESILEVVLLIHEANAVSHHLAVVVHFNAASIAEHTVVCSLRLEDVCFPVLVLFQVFD